MQYKIKRESRKKKIFHKSQIEDKSAILHLFANEMIFSAAQT